MSGWEIMRNWLIKLLGGVPQEQHLEILRISRKWDDQDIEIVAYSRCFEDIIRAHKEDKCFAHVSDEGMEYYKIVRID